MINRGGNFVTWDFQSTSFTTLDPLVVPPIYDATKLIHDTVRNRLVMLMLNESQPTIWEYDIAANMWFERINMVPASFGRRDNFTLGFHPPTGNVIIYGGRNPSGVIQGDVWHYDGNQFYQAIVGTTPARREGAYMVYRSATQEMVMWGGSNGAALRDTWAYVPGNQSVSYTYYGTGCQGSVGVPYLDRIPNVLPYSGQRFSLMVKNTPFFTPVMMMLGFSNTTHQGLPLPYSLAPFGFPACSLLCSPDYVYTTTNVFGSSLWDIQLPPGMGGVTFYNQAVVFDVAAQPSGLTLSNAGRALVGY